jgi:hypothetical protein
MIGAITAGLFSAGVTASTNSYESIATFTGSGTPTSITFSSIPSTYKHLQIRMLARDSRAVTLEGYLIQFNGDTAANYSDHTLYGDGASAAAFANTSSTSMSPYAVASANASANVYGASVIDVLDYQNTNKYKTIRVLTGVDNNGSGVIGFSSGNWRSTSAVTSVTITAQVGNWQANSSFALYGIKG